MILPVKPSWCASTLRPCTDWSATLADDICVLTERSVRPIVVAPDRTAGRAIVRAMNRSTNIALSLYGSDAALGGVLYAA